MLSNICSSYGVRIYIMPKFWFIHASVDRKWQVTQPPPFFFQKPWLVLFLHNYQRANRIRILHQPAIDIGFRSMTENVH